MIVNHKTQQELENNFTLIKVNKDIEKISEYNSEKILNYGIDFKKIPIKEGVIVKEIIDNKCLFLKNPKRDKAYYYFKIEEEKMLLEYYTYQNNAFLPEQSFEIDFANDKTIDNEFNPLKLNAFQKEYYRLSSKDKLRQNQTILRTIQYMLYVAFTKQDVNINVKFIKNVNKKKNENKTIINKEKIEVWNKDKLIYVVDGEKKTLSTFNKYNRHKDSWNVIGHFRHYKSGLVTWIESYVKGNGKIENKKFEIK